MNDSTTADRFRTTVLGFLAAVALGWILHIGKSVLVPIVFSVLVVYVIVGLARLLLRLPLAGRMIPPPVGHALSALVIAGTLVFLASLIAANVGRVAELAPRYSAALLNMIQDVAARFGVEAAPTWQTVRADLLAQINTHRLIGSTVLSVTAIIASLTVVLLYIAFMLIELRGFPDKIGRLSSDPAKVAALRKILGNINARIGTYLAMKTVVSVAQGLVSWAILAGFGVEFALFWAVLIGLLNYIPYVGSVLGVLLPCAFAAMQFGELGTVLAIAASLSAAQFVIGFFVDPYLMGSTLNLSPFVILVSLAAWSALWGIAGAFLAVPITACLVLVFAEFPGTRPIAVLLSRSGEI
ncbi:MAG: AI-2E family transporter [Burkholderiales bacterium]|nr:AI-2E family transporter [Burkholderiales bacterium]